MNVPTFDSAPAKPPTDEPGPLAAVAALVMVAALVFGVIFSYGDTRIEYRQQARHGMDLLGQGRYTEAQQLYEQMLPRYSATEARLGLSYAYLARRDAGGAEAHARLALQSAPPDWRPAAWAQLGRVLLFKGDAAAAFDAWRSAITSAQPYVGSAPIDAEVHSALWHSAMVLWQRGDFKGARSDLENLVAGADVYAMSASVKLAQLLAPTDKDISQKYSLEARSTLGATGAAIPNLRVPGLEEGLSREVATGELDQLDKSAADISKLPAGSAGNGVAAATWGRSFLQQEEPYLAAQQLKQAVKLQPHVSDAHSYYGLALLETGQQDEAISQLKEAASLDPTRALPHQALARIYVSGKSWDNALAELSDVKHLDPDSVTTHLQLADFYAQRGAYNNAEDEYIAAFEKEQADPRTPSGLDAALALSRFYTDVRGQGCEKGLAPAQASLARHPGDPASLDAVGWSLALCGKADSSLSSLEKAVQTAPYVARYRFHLGKAYAALGRASDAHGQYVMAIDLDPGGQWAHLSLSELPNVP